MVKAFVQGTRGSSRSRLDPPPLLIETVAPGGCKAQHIGTGGLGNRQVDWSPDAASDQQGGLGES